MKHKSTIYYKNRADRLFSLWVRQRDAMEGVCRCITCNTPHPWRSIHCGHFMSRRHELTRYNEKNAHAQCVHCNTFDQGEQYKHGMAIHKKYGNGRDFNFLADNLTKLSKISCKRSWFDYKIIGDELLEKLKANSYLTK